MSQTANVTSLSVRSCKKNGDCIAFLSFDFWISPIYVCGRVVCTSQFTAKENIGCSGQNEPFPQVLLSPACVPCGW